MSSKILNTHFVISKRIFDPVIEEERKLAFSFLRSNSWKGLTKDGTCPYVCEWPYLNVPSMLKDRLIEYYSNSI